MRIASVFAIALGVLAVSATPEAAVAQSFGGESQGRDCQTIRTCNFSRRGAFRGCLSSYTCRTCRFVPSCERVGRQRVCANRLRCTWGA
ncbi:MAG: hypothetical protein KDJ41_12370 [Hyphomicrobiaceae bacterium]|nr:hypothetical protein [Hyphomicrobiaceae bacterium]